MALHQAGPGRGIIMRDGDIGLAHAEVELVVRQQPGLTSMSGYMAMNSCICAGEPGRAENRPWSVTFRRPAGLVLVGAQAAPRRLFTLGRHCRRAVR